MLIKFNTTDEKYNPSKADNASAGFDLKARVESGSVVLEGNSEIVIPLGVRMNIPEGFEGVIRGRSGLWFKHGINIGQEGTIDAGYLGEICVKLINTTPNPYTITDGERVCQIVFHELHHIELSHIDKESFDGIKTERGEGGFGHSGRI